MLGGQVLARVTGMSLHMGAPPDLLASCERQRDSGCRSADYRCCTLNLTSRAAVVLPRAASTVSRYWPGPRRARDRSSR
jgi:hypothetical protein